MSVNEREEIVNPARYTKNSIECWDFIITYQLDFLMASIVKYIWRHKYKNGIDDLEKALIFLEKRRNTPISYGGMDTSQIEHILMVREDYPDFDDRQFKIIELCSYIPFAISLGQSSFIENIDKIQYQIELYIRYISGKEGL